VTASPDDLEAKIVAFIGESEKTLDIALHELERIRAISEPWRQ
jgi:hypothetical protein